MHRLKKYQSEMLHDKDRRMGVIDEVLNSIRVIKFYAWEQRFTEKIHTARVQEVHSPAIDTYNRKTHRLINLINLIRFIGLRVFLLLQMFLCHMSEILYDYTGTTRSFINLSIVPTIGTSLAAKQPQEALPD